MTKTKYICMQIPQNRTSKCSIDISFGVVQPTCTTSSTSNLGGGGGVEATVLNAINIIYV